MKSIAFRSALEKTQRRSAARLFGYVLLAMLLAASGASAQASRLRLRRAANPRGGGQSVTNKIT